MRLRTYLALAATAAFTAGALVLAPAPKARAEGKVDFVKDVQPILATSCVKCHGADPKGKKPKGKFDMTTKEAFFKGGDTKDDIVPGQPEKSLVYKTLLGPVGSGDDEIGRMPYKKDPLSQKEIDTIKQWIKDGAEWPDSVKKIQLKE